MTLDVYADLFDDDLDELSERMGEMLARENVGKMWAKEVFEGRVIEPGSKAVCFFSGGFESHRRHLHWTAVSIVCRGDFSYRSPSRNKQPLVCVML